MLFFLFEFFSDQLLAFMVLSVVWLSEIFSVISLRTYPSMLFFPRAFFFYFSFFHIYFFSFPFGFSYLSLLTTVLFIQHSMIFCWNNFEIPALECGLITALTLRVGMESNPSGDRNISYENINNNNNSNNNNNNYSNNNSNNSSNHNINSRPSSEEIDLHQQHPQQQAPSYVTPQISFLPHSQSQSHLFSQNQNSNEITNQNNNLSQNISQNQGILPINTDFRPIDSIHPTGIYLRPRSSTEHDSDYEDHLRDSYSRHVELSRRIQQEQLSAMLRIHVAQQPLTQMLPQTTPLSVLSHNNSFSYSMNNSPHNRSNYNSNNLNNLNNSIILSSINVINRRRQRRHRRNRII